MTPGPGIEPGTHWWEVRALTTVPILLPPKSKTIQANSWYPYIVNFVSKISYLLIKQLSDFQQQYKKIHLLSNLWDFQQLSKTSHFAEQIE